MELKCPACESGEHVVGVEVRGVYDGVLFWKCDGCGHAWSRNWSGFGRRQEIADAMVAAHNRVVR